MEDRILGMMNSIIFSWDWTAPDWPEIIVSAVISLISAVLIALITSVVLNRILANDRAVGKSLREYGINAIHINNGKLSSKARHILFGEYDHPAPKEVDLCFISGFGFFHDYKEKIQSIVERGTVVKVLLGKPEGKFSYLKEGDIFSKKEECLHTEEEKEKSEDTALKMTDYYYPLIRKDKIDKSRYSFLEINYAMLLYGKLKVIFNKETLDGISEESIRREIKGIILEKSGDHIYQIITVINLINSINEELKDKDIQPIEVHYYKNEYRMPITLATVNPSDKKNKGTCSYLWTNFNSPVVETTESINVFCSKKESANNRGKLYINDIKEYFDYLYDKSGMSPTEDK